MSPGVGWGGESKLDGWKHSAIKVIFQRGNFIDERLRVGSLMYKVKTFD